MERPYEEWVTAFNELRRQQQFIFSHAKELKLTHQSLRDNLMELCKGIAEIMKCERVSIWLYDEHHNRLVAQNSFDSSNSHHYSGQELKRSDYPTYFKAIESERVLAVDDILTDPSMEELKLWYFEQTDPVAGLIDATIILSRGLGGVLCCETRNKRTWTSLDKILIAAIADMVSFIFDRLHRIDMEKHVHTLAYTDMLTGLHNRHSFDEAVTEQLQNQRQGQRGMFIYLVIDQYTEVQSALGHDCASQLLRMIGERVRKLFPPPAITARFAFDHFLIYSAFEGQLDSDLLFRRMELVTNELRRPLFLSGQEVYMTFSYGISIFPDHAECPLLGVQQAYLALETARQDTKRKACGLYEPLMQEHVKQTMFSEMNLRKGLDANEFKLYYQPQVDLNGVVQGVEALIRWEHSHRGLVTPDGFIELAESTGLIIPLGEWVIRQAMMQLAEWKRMGYGHLTISVNISPRHFLHPNFPFYLRKCMDDFGVESGQMILEITENVALENHVAVQKRMEIITEMGVSVSIDDFGKGYSAFIYLQRFPVKQIKIDRQFISGLGNDPKSCSIVKTIIHLANMLGLDTIAEGIETAAQWEIVRELECTGAQGFYFGKPAPVEEFDQLLATSKAGVTLPLVSISK
ncbi:putative bifunctional diguanylate cyclase/phosphodiesterase [Sporosarcina cyprini]|uniref:putative bifunctional diguanylate cyclase/phosphodiesterase n=1 Tax=Sporosarcina cyprini TaxID=2910523 RepID=UPI001EDE7820|nr:GGDEF and EAL domain-containing protein [Sporosarcina cyprini]MCG3088208.1 GGDEF and EAL domain-containing protein [Sporosarcina cyprini]